MRVLGICGAAILAAMILAVSAQPGLAQNYPYCAHYGGSFGGAPNCGFTTWDQCMAAVSGTQGTCEMNPWASGPSSGQRIRRPRLIGNN